MTDIRTEQIAIRLTEDELKECEGAAKGRALAEWARPFVLTGARGPDRFHVAVEAEVIALRAIVIGIVTDFVLGKTISSETITRYIKLADRDKVTEALKRLAVA